MVLTIGTLLRHWRESVIVSITVRSSKTTPISLSHIRRQLGPRSKNSHAAIIAASASISEGKLATARSTLRDVAALSVAGTDNAPHEAITARALSRCARAAW